MNESLINLLDGRNKNQHEFELILKFNYLTNMINNKYTGDDNDS